MYTNWRKRGYESNPFYGRKHTLEARQQQSIANIGKKSSLKG